MLLLSFHELLFKKREDVLNLFKCLGSKCIDLFINIHFGENKCWFVLIYLI